MRVWSLRTVLFLLLCAGVGLMTIIAPSSAARAADEVPAQWAKLPPHAVQLTLQNVTAGEFAYWGRHGRYGSKEELLDCSCHHIGFVAAKWLDKCEVATSSNGQQFIVLAKNDATHQAWYMNQYGVPRETNPADTAEELVSVEQFFALKTAGEVQHQFQISVLQHYAHWVELGLHRYAVDHQGYYPDAMWRVQKGYYLGIPKGDKEEGYYPNPVTGWDTNWYGARCMEAGRWSGGDFSYLPIAAGPATATEPGVNFTGYILIFYGESKGGGLDVTGDGKADGVAVVLSSDENWRTRWQNALSDAFSHPFEK